MSPDEITERATAAVVVYLVRMPDGTYVGNLEVQTEGDETNLDLLSKASELVNMAMHTEASHQVGPR